MGAAPCDPLQLCGSHLHPRCVSTSGTAGVGKYKERRSCQLRPRSTRCMKKASVLNSLSNAVRTLAMVRATGLEPARLSQRNLNPPSLPIPPRPRVACNRVILSWEPGNVNGRQPEPLKFQANADPCPNKFLKVSVLSGKMTVCKDSHRQEMAKAHGAERVF